MTTFIKSVYAGFMIGVGGCVYLSVDNKIVSSLLFSFGLLTIVVQGSLCIQEDWVCIKCKRAYDHANHYFGKLYRNLPNGDVL